MKTTITQCDKCGKEIHPLEHSAGVNVTLWKTCDAPLREIRSLDFCMGCTGQILLSALNANSVELIRPLC